MKLLSVLALVLFVSNASFANETAAPAASPAEKVAEGGVKATKAKPAKKSEEKKADGAHSKDDGHGH